MIAHKRIIPCLDIKDGRVVKGVNFADLKDAGDPVAIAVAYEKAGADELMFLDVTATDEGRLTALETVRQIAEQVSIPFAVGGGIKTVDDIEEVFSAGATKVVISSAAVANPDLIRSAGRFGKHRIIVGIDAGRCPDNIHYNVYTNSGKNDSGIDAIDWAVRVEEYGAGEILLTSIDCDGTKSGYDIELLRAITARVSIPVIASGGAGSCDHFFAALTEGGADAALAASLFHFNELTIGEVKEYLSAKWGAP